MKSIKIYLIWAAVFAIFSLNAQENSGSQKTANSANAVTTIDMLALYPNVQGTDSTAYFYLNTQGRKFSALTATLYKNARELTLLKTVDLMPLLPDNTFSTPQIFPIEWGAAKAVAVINGTYADDASAYKSATFEKMQQYVNFNDIAPATVNGTSTPVSAVTGWGTLGINRSVEGTELNITGQVYTLGYGVHANGWLKCVFAAGVYNRFVVDVGKQNGKPYLMIFNLKKNNVQLTTTGSVTSSVKTVWDYPLENTVTSVQIDAATGADGNSSDHGSIGAPRLYYALPQKKAQTISWASASQTVYNYKPFQLPLNAVATSGLAPIYRIKQGAEYATVINGNVLNVTKMPATSALIEVEALQPGNTEWSAASIAACQITLMNGLSIQKNESVTIQNGDSISHLIIYADKNSAGQAYVANGFAKVGKFTLKYTLTPGKWQYVTFPADADLQKISNFSTLGYTLGVNTAATDKAYFFLREFDPAQAQSPNNGAAWNTLTSSIVTANKGYLMGVNNVAGSEPKEVTFTFDNVTADLSSLRIMNLTLDMSGTAPNALSDVYVSPANVKGNTLKVTVKNEPANVQPQPVNRAQALQQARFTYNAQTREIRLTLPDDYPAKIAIYKNKAMTKLYKAVKYISPMAIDVSGLKKGTYQAIVQYGDAVEMKMIEVK